MNIGRLVETLRHSRREPGDSEISWKWENLTVKLCSRVTGTWLLFILFSPGALACSSESTTPATTVAPNLAGVLAATPDLSYSAELLRLTQTDDVLRGLSPHTVLAPTNAAIDSFARDMGFSGGQELVDAVRADPNGTGAFVSNLVVDGQVNAKAFTENVGETFVSRGGIKMTIEIVSGIVKLRTDKAVVSVIAVDISLGSTFAHVVDAFPS